MNKTGIDIISRRITKLEKGAIRFALDLPKGSVCLDLGAGSGWLGIILAFLHHKVYFIDRRVNWKVRTLKKLFNLNIVLIQKCVRRMNYADFPDDISLVYSSRFWHYLSPEEAVQTLKILKKKVKTNGKLFFSISGIESKLGKEYQGPYNFLSLENQQKFQIKERVTLYSQQQAQDLFSQYFEVKEIWQSDFGNVFLNAIKK